MTGRYRTSVLPELPAALAARGIGIRHEAKDDLAFMQALYCAVRLPELDATGWPDAMRTHFLVQQFELQRLHFTTHYPGAAFGVLCEREQPIGRVYLHQGPSDLRIMDISLLESHRGLGIGSAVLMSVFELGERARTGVSIHVETFNRKARQLYERLGFVCTEDLGVYHRMDRAPQPQAA